MTRRPIRQRRWPTMLAIFRTSTVTMPEPTPVREAVRYKPEDLDACTALTEMALERGTVDIALRYVKAEERLDPQRRRGGHPSGQGRSWRTASTMPRRPFAMCTGP